LKIIAVIVALLVLSAVVVAAIIQEQNQAPPESTTPYYIYVNREAVPNYFYMDADGTRYYNESATFYWVVGTTHTVTVPSYINYQKNPILPPLIQPESWRLIWLGNSKSNTIYVTVQNVTDWLHGSNVLDIRYEAIYNQTR
jgi:hypothetical protein